MSSLLPLLSLVLPFVALIIERFLPYPYFVEEVLKGILVINLDKKHRIMLSIAIGVLFALTETVIYSTSLFLVGGVGVFITRFVLTAFVHSLTCVVMALSIYKTKKGFVIGLILAILIHWFYNTSVKGSI